MSCFCRKLAEPLIRPPRSIYDLKELGTAGHQVFRVDQILCEREDFVVLNRNGLRLACSLYHPSRVGREMPCVIYLHGNIGCRLSSLGLVESLMARGMSLVCFDFAGCGHSEGEYISLGYYQYLDVQTVVDFLKKQKNFARFVFWGRSMGAVAAIRFQQHFKEGMGLVLDSPYSDFRKLANELVEKRSFFLSLFTQPLLRLLSYGTQQRINMDLSEFKPVESAKFIHCPVYFIASEDDEIVHPDHVRAYYQQCAARRKQMRVLEGGHNDNRSRQLIDNILSWLLGGDKDEVVNTQSTVANIRELIPQGTGRMLTEESEFISVTHA